MQALGVRRALFDVTYRREISQIDSVCLVFTSMSMSFRWRENEKLQIEIFLLPRNFPHQRKGRFKRTRFS
jgi:hypothetical protein